MRRTLQEAANFIAETLKEFDIVSSNRFQKMIAPFASGNNTIEPEDKQFLAARAALRDLRILEFCIDNLRWNIDEAILKSKLQEVVKEPLSPADKPSGGTRGRNTQAELFVAAICQKARLFPKFEEPDLLIRMPNGGDLAIAVKRPQSESKLNKLIREAIEQIRRSGYPGVIVVDGSLMANPQNHELRGNIPADVVTDAAKIYVQELARQGMAFRKRRLKGVELVAIVFQFHVLQYRSGNDWGLISVTIPLNPNKSNSRRTEMFERFEKAFSKGLPD